MRVVFRPEAQRELLEARAWYEERSPGLGFEFARALDVAVAMAQRMPLAYPRIEADFRHVTVRKFPYAVIYSPSKTELVVVPCFHHRRKPGSWIRHVKQSQDR